MRVGTLWMVVMVCFEVGEGTGCSDRDNISVSKLSKVVIFCPPNKSSSSEINYQLLFNGQSIFSLKKHSTMFEITATHSGIYTCKSEIIYPPPYKEDCWRTQINVTENSSTSTNGSVLACPGRAPLIPEVVMWTGCGVLLVYSLTITCITIAIWKKQKKEENNTVIYENTRPREFKKPPKFA